MELCEGDLTNYVTGQLKEIPKNSLDDKIILGEVTLGLSYIHSKGMIHKDLKPENILLWRSPKSSRLVLAKIADFGFAKQLKPGKDEFSETLHPGTKSCMAPELLAVKEGEKVPATFEGDAYALGITIAYTVLKGRHPFGSKLLQPLLMSRGCDPILLGELNWDVTHLILQLTKNEPKERPSVAFVIYHPYFVLTNENTKAHFEEKINEYFRICQDNRKTTDNICWKVFEKKNIEMWRDSISRQKENERNSNMSQLLEKVFL